MGLFDQFPVDRPLWIIQCQILQLLLSIINFSWTAMVFYLSLLVRGW